MSTKHATYAWIIDRVNVADLGADSADEKGVRGPHNASPELLAELANGGGYTFRMLDDDGIWYYRGRIAVENGARPELYTPRSGEHGRTLIASVPWGEDEALGPLDDFGTPNAGCTELQYRITGPDGEPAWGAC
jgi:hypothetical protein